MKNVGKSGRCGRFWNLWVPVLLWLACIIPSFALNPSTQRVMGRNPVFQDVHANLESGKPSAYSLERTGVPSWTSRALKIRILSQGLYRLSYDRLKDAGLPGSIQGSDLRLWCMGREVATWVSQDGGWRPGDSLVFYAENVAGSHSSENVVWLTHAPPPDGRPALRMEVGREAPYDSRALTSARAEEVIATPSLYRTYWQPTTDKGAWFVAAIGILRPFETRFHPTRPASPANPSLVLQLEDGHARWFQSDPKSLSCVVDGAHRSIAYQNPGRSNPDGDSAAVRVPLSGLDGDGVDLRLEQTDGEALLRWAALQYDRLLEPQADGTLCFDGTVDASSTFQLRGFQPGTTWVLDVGDVFRPRVLPLSSRAQFLGSKSVYYVCPLKNIKEPSVQPVTFLTSAPSEGGEALVIADTAVFPSVGRYAAYRSSRGTPCRVVALSRIMDTFGYGVNDPGAIRRFVGHLYHHGSRPRSVMLVGDGSFDPLGFAGTEVDRLPAVMGPGGFERGTHDGWFGSVDGDDVLPDLPVGRLPADSDVELQLIIEKIKDYEADLGTSWKRRAFWATDARDRAGDFRATALSLQETDPGWVSNDSIHIDEVGSTVVSKQLQQAFGGQYGHIIYIGHGYSSGLGFHDGKHLFGRDNSGALTNQRHPIVTALSCSAGIFHLPGEQTFGEALLFQPHGAVAVMAAPSRMGLTMSKIMGETMMREGSGGNVRTLGEVLLAAKQSLFFRGSSAASVQQFGLLGDPNLELQAPVAARQHTHSPRLEITARDSDWFRLEWDSVPGQHYQIATCGDLATKPFSAGSMTIPSAGQRTSIWLRPGPHEVCSYRLESVPDAR